MNCLNVIHPYLLNNIWVFDDPNRELKQEALIAGMPEMLAYICAIEQIPLDQLSLIFSAIPFPGWKYQLVKLDRSGDLSYEDDGKIISITGNWYNLKGTDLEGWLCPALLKYFDNAPLHIYVQPCVYSK
jgi:hypothetical protein